MKPFPKKSIKDNTDQIIALIHKLNLLKNKAFLIYA